jgi:hypothetical protein
LEDTTSVPAGNRLREATNGTLVKKIRTAGITERLFHSACCVGGVTFSYPRPWEGSIGFNKPYVDAASIAHLFVFAFTRGARMPHLPRICPEQPVVFFGVVQARAFARPSAFVLVVLRNGYGSQALGGGLVQWG